MSKRRTKLRGEIFSAVERFDDYFIELEDEIEKLEKERDELKELVKDAEERIGDLENERDGLALEIIDLKNDSLRDSLAS